MKNIKLVTELSTVPEATENALDEYEVGLCISGERTLFSGGKAYRITEGTAYICPPTVPHTNVIANDSSYSSIIIRYENDEEDETINGFYTAEDKDSILYNMFDIAITCYNADSVANEKTISYLTDAICQYIVGEKKSSKLSACVSILRDKIDREFSDSEFRVPKAITELGYNTDYMRRLFKAEMGISPTDYLTEKRIECAKTLLKSGKVLSVTQIAYACGFYDSNYFTRLFKQNVGMVPTDYRKNG